MLSNQAPVMSPQPSCLALTVPQDPRESTLGHHYIAATRYRRTWLVSGPYPDRLAVARYLERARAIACGHSPESEHFTWGGFQTTDCGKAPFGLLESRLGYPLPKTSLCTSRPPMSRRQFEAFVRSVQARGFNRVLTHCGPLPIEKWRPVNLFWGHGAGLDPFCAGFDWVGANLIRSLPTEVGSAHMERVWTLGIEGPYAFTSAPSNIGGKDWRIIVRRDRRTIRFEWRRHAAGEWNSHEEWPTYSPQKTLLGLPDAVHTLEERHANALEKVLLGDIFGRETIFGRESQTPLEGDWYDVELDNGSLAGPSGPQERAIQRWIMRAMDVPGTPREQLQNFLAQRFTRHELLRFWADVRLLCWPGPRNGAPWKTAQHVASCVFNGRTQEIVRPYAEDLEPHILASLAVPVEDWARSPAPSAQGIESLPVGALRMS
jgi:hypothetical protein